MTQTAATRVVNGNELPAPGVWTVDPHHAEVGFVGRHFMMTKVRGRFTAVNGEVRIADRPEDSSVAATIEMASVFSGDDARDENLRSPDLFDVERYPEARFTSTEISWSGTQGEMTGELTIKDVTRPVTLQVSYVGHASDPWGNDRAGFEAHGRIDRENWGLTWNMLLESGGLMISKEIDLEIHLELVLTR